tara:strand:+ start:609 stop:872 length:264 start_codon:yes stop_codon:yes gene_type:complete
MSKDKEHSALRKAMSKLDSAIPDYVFDDDEGSELSQCISDVWDEIAKVERDISSYIYFMRIDMEGNERKEHVIELLKRNKLTTKEKE